MKVRELTQKALYTKYSPIILALFGLFALEAICFLPALRASGFYLDDWVFLLVFKNGPNGFWQAIENLHATDPRFLNRPVEAMLFLSAFKCFGLNPFGYHLFNACMEVLAATLLFLVVRRTGKDSALAFLASAIFLLLPTHNASHYWVSCICVNFSLCLYCGSLLADIIGAERNNLKWHTISCILFSISLFNYELFLPLICLNIMLVIKLKRDQGQNLFSALRGTIPVILLLTGAIFILLFYLKVVMPNLGKAWSHAVNIDPSLILNTVLEGTRIHLPPYFTTHFGNVIHSTYATGVSIPEALSLTCIALIVTLVSVLLALGEKNNGPIQVSAQLGLQFLLLGSISFLASYTIFGLNQEYFPTYLTFVNRINTGAAVSITFCVYGVLLYLRAFEKRTLAKRAYAFLFPILFSSSTAVLFCLINWALARPYTLSWQVQSHVAKFLKSNGDKLQNAKSLIIANAPCYVDEAPVFDGVWDFQSMARIMLERPEIQGGVVSDRLRISEKNLQDYSGTFLCATYPFEGLYIIFSPECDLTRVATATEFIELINNRGLQFKSKALPDRWRSQLCNRDRNKGASESKKTE